MVSTRDLQGNEFLGKATPSAAGADSCSFIRIRYDGPREGALVEVLGSSICFYHYTQSTRFTLDTAVGGDGCIEVEQSNSGVATKSKAGQIVSMINAATYWVAWLAGAAYDTPVTSSTFSEQTYGTANVSSSDFGAGIKMDSSVRKYHELSVGYIQKYTDMKEGADDSADARGPRLYTLGDADYQKQGKAEITSITVGKDTATGSTVQATLSVVAEKVSAVGTANRRTLHLLNIASVNGPTLMGTGIKLNFDDLEGALGERLIVRLESGGTPIGTFQLNVAGKWKPNPTLGA